MKLINHVTLFLLLAVFVLFGCATSGNRIAIEELHSKANQGDVNAQIQLCRAYDQGYGVTRNQAEAASWCRKAAEQGNAVAQNTLGSMYQFGEGVPKDNAEAVRWYQKAADQGYGEACTNLGYMYDGGLGINQDKQNAVKLYHSGAEKGSLNAMLNLGVSYWRGEGVPKNLEQSYMWLNLVRFYTQQSNNIQLKWRVRGVLDEVKKEMTKEQINKAEQLSREWDAKHRSK